MPFPGSDLGQALSLADTISNRTEAPGRVLLISDDFNEATFEQIQNFALYSNNQITIMPMNTVGGSNVPAKRKNQFLKDVNGKIVRSALDKNMIEKMASLENVSIAPLTLDKSDVQLLAKNISENLEFKQETEEKENNWKDDGLWLVIPFALIILLWFRKGWVIYSLLIVFTFSSCGKESSFIDLWETKDFQAQKHYDKADYDKAGLLYTDPIYQGVAWYKAGDYDKAIRAFEKDTTAMGVYNLGLAYYKNGDYAAAAMAFGKATELDPELEAAQQNQMVIQKILEGTNEVDPEEAKEAPKKQTSENIENKDMEDLGGGGQEATEEDMKQERKEETVNTEMRTGKEMDEVPPDFESGNSENSQKVLMRKVDDDPSLFLKRKFNYQVKKKNLKPDNKGTTW